MCECVNTDEISSDLRLFSLFSNLLIVQAHIKNAKRLKLKFESGVNAGSVKKIRISGNRDLFWHQMKKWVLNSVDILNLIMPIARRDTYF